MGSCIGFSGTWSVKRHRCRWWWCPAWMETTYAISSKKRNIMVACYPAFTAIRARLRHQRTGTKSRHITKPLMCRNSNQRTSILNHRRLSKILSETFVRHRPSRHQRTRTWGIDWGRAEWNQMKATKNLLRRSHQSWWKPLIHRF